MGDEFGAFDAVMPSRTRRRGPAPRSHRAAWPVTTSVCTPPLGPLLAVANEDLPPLTASGAFCHGARTSGRSPCPGLGGRHRASPTRRARAASFILRLRLVTSQGSPYPSRSPRAHPSGWTRTARALLPSVLHVARPLILRKCWPRVSPPITALLRELALCGSRGAHARLRSVQKPFNLYR